MPLSKSQQTFIENNSADLTVTEIARRLGAAKQDVKKYIREKGLSRCTQRMQASGTGDERAAAWGYAGDGPLPGRFLLMVYGALLGITALVFANTVGNSFVFDDLYVVVHNTLIRNFSHIPAILGFHGVPLRTLSYVLDYAVSQYNVWGYHCFNIFYHSIVGFLVFRIIQLMIGARLPAFIAAVLFIVHPVQTDSVSYISGRRDILMGLFYFLSFYGFVRGREEGKRRWYLLSLLSFYIGYWAKEMIVTLPAVCFLYDVIRTAALRETRQAGRGAAAVVESMLSVVRKRYVFYGIMGALAVYFAYYTVFSASASQYVQTGTSATGTQMVESVHYYGGSLLVTIMTIPWIIFNYLFLLVYPAKLLCDYSFNAFPLVYSVFSLNGLLGLGSLVGLLWLVAGLWRREKGVAFGIGWFLIVLLPVYQIIPHHEIFAVHYLYVPLFGFVYLVAVLLKKQAARKWVFVLAGIIIVLCVVRSVVRNFDWKNELSLNLKNVADAPQSVRSHINLGRYYAEVEKDFPRAIKENEMALKIDGENRIGSIAHVVHNNLGNIYFETGQYEKAEQEYRRAIELFPDPSYISNLAALYSKQGLHYKAIRVLEDILKQHPQAAVAYAKLGDQYVLLNRFDEAEKAYRTALSYDAYMLDARSNLVQLLRMKGKAKEAQQEAATLARMRQQSQGI